MPTELELNCWVVGNEPHRIFPVKIQNSESVGTLKEEIKKKNPDIVCPADTLIVWKNETRDVNDDDLLQLSRDAGNIPGAQKLDARRRLWRVFAETPEDEQIHIFVQRPAPPATFSPPQSARSSRSIHADHEAELSGVAKHRRDFDKFHSENGVRTVLGSIGPVHNVRMLLKSGYRHVYISRKFAMRHGFIPSDAAPGNYGYSGLINLGKWPVTLKTAAEFADEAAAAQATGDTAPSTSHPKPHKSKTVTVSVFLSEEPHFDVVLGRSFFEKRQIKISSIDPTEVICLDTGEKIECELVILKDGRGEVVIVT